MSTRTLFQDSARKKNQYGVIANGLDWEDVWYLPYDEVGTKRLNVLTAEVQYNYPTGELNFPADFIKHSAAGGGHPRTMQVAAGTWTHQLHAQGTAKSVVMMHVAKSIALPSHVSFTIGTAGAAASKITLGAGVATIDFTDAVQDDASSATSLSGAGVFAVALILDRSNDTLSLYEMDLDDINSSLALINQVTTTNGSATALQFNNPTTFTINSAFGLDTYGSLFASTDGGVRLPNNIVSRLEETAKNWAAGELGITIAR